MEFENLQAIWDTQADKPVFGINESGLLLSLYRHRERSRRSMARDNAVFYAAMLLMLLLLIGTGVVFSVKDAEKLGRDFPMTIGDGVICLVGMGAIAAVVVPMYMVRRRHERNQNAFAPTLREEIDRGIAQLDFEIEVANGWAFRNPLLLTVALAAVLIEMARLNGERWPSWSVWYLVALVPFSNWLTHIAVKESIRKTTLPRKRALEELRATLDEAH